MHLKAKSVVLALIALLLPVASYAEAPSGHYEIDIANPHIWDVSGTYTYDDTDDDITSSGELTLLQDLKGKITGTGTGTGSASADDGIVFLDFDLTITGSISSKNGVTRISLTNKVIGTAEYLGTIFPLTGSIKYTLDLDEANHILIGTVKGKLCIKGAGCAPLNDTTSLETEETDDGNWQLVLDLSTVNGNKVLGSAAVVLANGRTLPLATTGSYSAKTDVTKLSLKGSGGTLSLQGQILAGVVAIQKASGKLLGQTVKLP